MKDVPRETEVPDTTSIRHCNGRSFLRCIPSTETQPTGVGTDLGMVGGENTEGMTVEPSTQTRLTVDGGTQEVMVSVIFVNVSSKV